MAGKAAGWVAAGVVDSTDSQEHNKVVNIRAAADSHTDSMMMKSNEKTMTVPSVPPLSCRSPFNKLIWAETGKVRAASSGASRMWWNGHTSMVV